MMKGGDEEAVKRYERQLHAKPVREEAVKRYERQLHADCQEDIRDVEAIMKLYEAVKERHPTMKRKVIMKFIHMMLLKDLVGMMRDV